MVEDRRGRRWRIWVPISLSMGIYYGSIQQSVHGLLSHERWDWTEMAIIGGLWAVLWWPAQLLGQAFAQKCLDWGWVSKTPARRRRDEQQALIKPAIESGTLPADAEPEVWRPALRAAVHELNILRWTTMIGLAAMAGTIGAAATIANDNAWGVWAVAILVAAEGMAVFQLLGRRLLLIRQLLHQLY